MQSIQGCITNRNVSGKNRTNTQCFKKRYRLTSEYPTIATRLKNAGYVTGLMGKWHLGFSDASSPNENGFETFFGFKDWSIDYYTHRNITNDDGLYYNKKPVVVKGYSTDIFTDSAMAFINKNQQQPFFLCPFYNAALPPMQPRGTSGDIRNPSNWEKSTRQDYVGVVERMDHEIGKVLVPLQKDGLAQNTIVVFTYDHQGGRRKSWKIFSRLRYFVGRRNQGSADHTISKIEQKKCN